MRIEAQHGRATTLQQIRRAQDKNIQSVFSEVLENAGRPGYASADSVDDSQPLRDRVQASWDSWYRTELLGRYASPDAPQDLGETYGHVLLQAYDAGAYVDPKSFLNRLTEDELAVVQHAHWLADPIQVDSLTEEGALNLLIPPAAQIDLNRDGLTQAGLGYGIRFPDSTTPPAVVAAWEQTTEGLSLAERMTYELEMKLPVLLSNIVLDADGRFVHQREPGDPDFVNPMAAEDYSFVDVTQNWIDHLNYFKNQLDPAQFARSMDFWTSFQANLRHQGL